MIGQHRELAFEQRGVHALPAAAVRPRLQREQHADHAEHAGAYVGDGDSRLHRSAAFFPGDAHVARKRLHENVVGAVMRARAVGAESADAAIDEPRVDRGQRLVAEAEFVQGSDAVVVDQHVCPRGEFL